MRIVLATKSVPYPLSNGAAIRGFHMLQELRRRHSVALVTFVRSEEEERGLVAIKAICEHVYPVRESRTFQRRVTDLCRTWVSRLPYTVAAHTSSAFQEELRRAVWTTKADFVQLEELYLFENFRRSGLRLPVVLDAYNVEERILERLAAVEPNALKRHWYRAQAKLMRRFEQRALREVDGVISVSAIEHKEFSSRNSCVALAENGVEFKKEMSHRGMNEVPMLLYIGSLLYPPNRDAIIHFLNHIWPSILCRHPHAEFHIIGRVSRSDSKQFRRLGVRLLGAVQELQAHIDKAKLMVVPLRAGAGTRLKILTAFEYGLPVVSTSIGAEGLELSNEEHLLLADNPKEFADSVNRLIEDEGLAQRLSRNAFEWSQRTLQWPILIERLEPFYEKVVTRAASTKRLLITLPHDMLLREEGHRVRLGAFLRKLSDFELAFVIPDSLPLPHRDLLGSAPVYCFREPRLFGLKIPYLSGFAYSFRRACKLAFREFSPGAVVCDLPWGGEWLGRKVRFPLVFLSHGVEHDFTETTLLHLRMNFFPISFIARFLVHCLERATCRRAKLIITMSHFDTKRYIALYKVEPDRVVAMPQPVPRLERSEKRDALRRSLGIGLNEIVCVFHGSWHHVPNRVAVESIRSTIGPKLHRRGFRVRFLLAGTGMPTFREGRVVSMGFVEDLASFLAAGDIAVMPIFHGAGVRMKTFDYIQANLPIVTTRKAIEGVELIDGRDAVIAENQLESFITSLEMLVSSPQIWRTLSENALAFVGAMQAENSVSNLLVQRLPGAFRV